MHVQSAEGLLIIELTLKQVSDIDDQILQLNFHKSVLYFFCFWLLLLLHNIYLKKKNLNFYSSTFPQPSSLLVTRVELCLSRQTHDWHDWCHHGSTCGRGSAAHDATLVANDQMTSLRTTVSQRTQKIRNKKLKNN